MLVVVGIVIGYVVGITVSHLGYRYNADATIQYISRVRKDKGA